MLKIAIIGEQCAGKTTVAEILKQLMPLPGVVKFADPIYQAMVAMGVQKNRGYMQESSDVAKKYFGDDVYVKSFIERVQTVEQFGIVKSMICDDVRYPAEVEACLEMGFKLVHVEADRAIRYCRAVEQGLTFIEGHSSENQIKSLKKHAHAVVDNSGNSMSILKDRLINVIGELKFAA